MNAPRGRADFLRLGDWNAACFRCGRKIKASEAKKTWQNYWVCPEHWEPRQPQDFVRGVPDNPAPPWAQPQVAPQWLLFCTPNGRTGIVGYAVAGCAVVDFLDPAFDPNVTE